MPDSEITEGKCWLCGEHGRLSREHIPPCKAFNEYPLLLQKISEKSREVGSLIWEQGNRYEKGMIVRSLCGRCNSRAGSKFAPAYIQFVKTIAERIGDIRLRHKLTIQGITKPQLILKQILHQFVSANGSTFAAANPWVRPLLRSETTYELPPDVYMYVFATNMGGGRSTGISSHVSVTDKRVRVVSEFTFWPLGTVLSFGEINHDALTPIHHWSKYPHKANERVDITLCANPIASAYPIDFRDAEQILSERNNQADGTVDESTMLELQNQVFARTGNSARDSFVYSAHPSQVNLLAKKKGK